MCSVHDLLHLRTVFRNVLSGVSLAAMELEGGRAGGDLVAAVIICCLLLYRSRYPSNIA
jgi:hypothetical protein